MNSVFIRSIKMPLTVRAFTVTDADGNFNIYINEALSDEAKRKSLEHEKRHIIKNDFYSGATAATIEALSGF